MTLRAAAAMLVLVVTATGCDRMGQTVSDAFSARDTTATGVAMDRVERQLGGPTGATDTTAAAMLSSAFRAAAAKALPAVVQITTVSLVDVDAQAFGGRPDLEQMPEHQRTQGSGSGFIIDERGYILTNDHVVQNALNVRVSMLDGREFTAEVVGSDPSTDVAVIRIDAGDADLPVIDLGDSDRVRVGDWVIALGNPLSLSFTATAGIVSAKERSIRILGTDAPLESFIQTDAAINPGNSGGPLVDLNGRVIGINTAIESQTGYFTGAGFAVPITLARKVASDLIEHGVVRRPRLGVQIQDVSPADAELYKLSAVTGVEVTSVTPGEAAARAGLELGDVIMKVGGTQVHSVADLQARVALFQPGERITVDYVRYGRDMKATVALGEFEAERPAPRRAPDRSRNPLGFQVSILPPAIAAQIGLRDPDMPVVTQVDPFGPAASSGLQRGHIVRRINGRPVNDITDLERAAMSLKPGQIVSLIVDAATDPQSVPVIINFRAQ